MKTANSPHRSDSLTPSSSTKERILIVEDEPRNQLILRDYLQHMGLNTDIASTGDEGLKRAQERPYDLILLDIMMPRMSGYEVCKQLKNDAATAGIPILMVTALGELGDIERAVEAGTDDFLSKPVNKVELVKRVENMLKLRHVSDELERLRSYISTMDDDRPPR